MMDVSVDFFGKRAVLRIFDYDASVPHTIEHDIISKCIQRDKSWEPFQTELTHEILKDGGGVFVDVGAHFGYYSLLSALYGNTTVSVDGSRTMLDMLECMIAMNGLQNIKPVHTRLVPGMADTIGFADYERITLVKIDIEGCEHVCVSLLDEHLKAGRVDFLIVEISPRLNDNFVELVAQIHGHGYDVYDIGLSPQRPLNSAGTAHLDNMEHLNINSVISDGKLDAYVNGFPEGQSNFLFRFRGPRGGESTAQPTAQWRA